MAAGHVGENALLMGRARNYTIPVLTGQTGISKAVEK